MASGAAFVAVVVSLAAIVVSVAVVVVSVAVVVVGSVGLLEVQVPRS